MKDYTNLKDWSPKKLEKEHGKLDRVIKDTLRDFGKIRDELKLRKKMARVFVKKVSK